MQMFSTIRQFARAYALPEHMVRSLVKRGTLPGFSHGSRFYLHTELALRAIEELSRSNTMGEAAAP